MTNLTKIYNKPFLTPQEVSKVLSLNTLTVYKLLKTGKLKGSKILPKAWRVRKIDLEKFISGSSIKK